MKYYEVRFTISPMNSDACDLLAAIAGEAGFETFEETETGLTGYIQQTLYDQQALDDCLQDFPFDGITISYETSEAEDRDWNEQWEQQGFEPIIVSGEWKEEKGKRNVRTLVIHDGRHLPTDMSLTSHLIPEQSSPTRSLSPLTSVEIDAKMAFGTGTHETTRMICSTLLDLNLQGKRVLDCGTGTGILSICALKLGAREAVGYDIDEWSADNARHNAVINQVDCRFTSLLGDASILNKVEGVFDLVMANINRNILLADLPAFRRKLAPGGYIILSGFYTDDIPCLKKKGEALGLTLVAQKESGSWAALLLH